MGFRTTSLYDYNQAANDGHAIVHQPMNCGKSTNVLLDTRRNDIKLTLKDSHLAAPSMNNSSLKNRAKTGVLLINLGTPEGTSYWPMRRYLKEFLSDPRVIDRKGLVWWMILNGLILTKRPKKSARAYRKIWNDALDESPLKTITRAQAEKLSARLAAGSDIKVDWAMRYGLPSIAEGISRLHNKGCRRVLLFPLYPQYSGTTTESALDKAREALRNCQPEPDAKAVPPYFDDPTYINALAQSVIAHQRTLDWRPERQIVSFHGLPQAFIDRGDPYQQQCEKTAGLLREALGLERGGLLLAYQSSSGRGAWLGPALDQTLIDLAQSGVRNISVIAPGFASDCVETLEEIKIRAAKDFLENGGENFAYIPCLNDSNLSMDMIETLLNRQLKNWAQPISSQIPAVPVRFPSSPDEKPL